MGIPLAPSVQSPSAWGTRTNIGNRLNPRTTPEIGASITPDSTAYAAGDRRRSSWYQYPGAVDFGDVPTYVGVGTYEYEYYGVEIASVIYSVPGDKTTVYPKGSRVQLVGASTRIWGRVLKATYNGTTTTTLDLFNDRGGTPPEDPVSISVGVMAMMDRHNTFLMNENAPSGLEIVNTNLGALAASRISIGNFADSGVALVCVGDDYDGPNGAYLAGAPTGKCAILHTGFPVPIVIGVGDQTRILFPVGTSAVQMFGAEESMRYVSPREGDDLGGAWCSFYDVDNVTRKGYFGYANGGTNNNFVLVNEKAGALILEAQSGTARVASSTKRVEINDIVFITGTGSPEGVHTAPKGSLFMRTDGATANEALYVKTSGTGNTGWTAK